MDILYKSRLLSFRLKFYGILIFTLYVVYELSK